MANGSVTRRRFLKETGSLAALGAVGSLVSWGQLRANDPPRPGAADWPRYGYDIHNTRFNVKEQTLGLNNVERLKQKWQFETVDGWPIQTTPTVVGDTLFFGAGGWYYALESATGKLKWKFETGIVDEALAPQSDQNQVTRSSAQYVDGKVYFGDGFANVRSVDAATGRQLWKTAMEEDRRYQTSMRFSPLVYEGRVIAGHIGLDPKIVCLDAETGAVRWSWRVGQNMPRERMAGVGPLWTSAAVDEQQKIVYNVTGNAKLFMPAGPMFYASSMLAHDFYTGEFLWAHSPHPGDSLDLDFCAHPIVYDAEAPARGRGDRRFCVVAGSKAGVHCVNRYTGQPYWKVMLGQASGGGGPRVDALAVAYGKVFVQNSSPTSVPAFGVTAALNAYTGDIEWITPNPNLSQSPIAVANGLLYQGLVVGGKVEALDVNTGRRVWGYSLPSDYRGGAAIANGALYVSNGETDLQKRLNAGKGYNYSVYCFTIDGQ